MTRALATVAIGADGTGDCASATTLATSACKLGSISATPPGETDGIADAITNWTVNIKVTEPTLPLRGAAIFLTGGGGNAWWENSFPNSVAGVLNPALARGQRVIQLKWAGNGWDSGTEGPLALAARAASAFRKIFDDAALHTPGLPFCLVGQSSGSSQVAYALAHYGAGDYVDLAVMCSGPPHSRLDYGTFGGGIAAWAAAGPGLCTTGSTIQFAASEAAIVDNAYTGRTPCASRAMSGGVDSPGYRDSILRPDAALAFPFTQIHFVFGDADNTAPVPLGRHFARRLRSSYTENITTGGVTHANVPDSASGMAFIDAALAAAAYRR